MKSQTEKEYMLYKSTYVKVQTRQPNLQQQKAEQQLPAGGAGGA